MDEQKSDGSQHGNNLKERGVKEKLVTLAYTSRESHRTYGLRSYVWYVCMMAVPGALKMPSAVSVRIRHGSVSFRTIHPYTESFFNLSKLALINHRGISPCRVINGLATAITVPPATTVCLLSELLLLAISKSSRTHV
jgi:hypothetical protein